MRGEHKKGKGKQPRKAKKDGKPATEGATIEEHGDCNGGRGQHTELAAMDMEASIATIHADIKTVVTEIKSEQGNFRDSIREDLKREIADIREEIQHKLGQVAINFKATTKRV